MRYESKRLRSEKMRNEGLDYLFLMEMMKNLRFNVKGYRDMIVEEMRDCRIKINN
jgi:hypothetical protein